MIEQQRILAVVPARGGSKGVLKKNIRPVNGVPLIAFTARTIKACPFIDRAVVSTDSTEIASVAAGEGLSAPFTRPVDISGDRIADWDVLVHALQEMEKLDRITYDVVVMLQPTSPLRRPAHVHEVVERLVRERLDAVWTVSPTDLKFHPLKQLIVDQDGRMDYFDARGSTIVARQQLSPVFHRNGLVYAMTRSCLLEQKKIMGERSGAVVVTDPIVNIDTLEDFQTLERLLAEQSART
ncbi:MAG: acylneuraminate cytidylyltransferase family protein [Gammaproteobacteria bacterium]|nr:acylneuraminate cytidylyltransferase family protein [Gammaproteobacteria bacterium]